MLAAVGVDCVVDNFYRKGNLMIGLKLQKIGFLVSDVFSVLSILAWGAVKFISDQGVYRIVVISILAVWAILFFLMRRSWKRMDWSVEHRPCLYVDAALTSRIAQIGGILTIYRLSRLSVDSISVLRESNKNCHFKPLVSDAVASFIPAKAGYFAIFALLFLVFREEVPDINTNNLVYSIMRENTMVNIALRVFWAVITYNVLMAALLQNFLLVNGKVRKVVL